MGIPNTAFETGDLYMEYGFEEVLFRYEKQTARFFGKFYGEPDEHPVAHDNKLLCEARSAGVLTTAERYFTGLAPAPLTYPTAGNLPRAAATYQRTRPYWLTVKYLDSYTRSGDIEVGVDACLKVVKAADSIRALLERAVSDINGQPCLTVICADGIPMTVCKTSNVYDFGLRLELKRRNFTVIGESSFYLGRSAP